MRVFLFLLLTTTAAAQPIECAHDTGIHYDSEFRLVRIPRPTVKGMLRKQIDDVTIYARQQRVGGWEQFPDSRNLSLFAERGGVWYQLHDGDRGAPHIAYAHHLSPETKAPPVITRAKRGEPLIRVTWVEHWMGANRAGHTRHTVLLDFRAKPRVLLSIDCSDFGGGGACTAPDALHNARNELTCDQDLHCTMRQTVFLDWTTRGATRRFDLLANETLPPSRFDAFRYASGAAFAAAGPDAIRQRALIDGIGIVEPVYRVSPHQLLFAAHSLAPVAGFRFFLLDRGTWREIPLTLITDSRYPGGENDLRGAASAIERGFTPDAPQLVFSASDLGLRGRRKLIEVIGTEGDARSRYWIMLDPAGRNGALRLSSNQPEWRHCGDVVYPISVTFLEEWSETGLPAIFSAVASWRLGDLEHGTMPRTCGVSGTIDWSTKRGWIVRLGQAPCTDPIPRPYAVEIEEDGTTYPSVVSAPDPR